MKTAALETSELGYLLAVLDCGPVFGVDNGSLLPDAAKTRNALHEQGLSSLRKNGWVVPGSEPGSEVLNAELMVWVEAMSRAPVALAVDRRAEGDDGHIRFVYYLTDYLVLEQAFVAGQRYRLTRLADLETLLMRVIHLTKLPEAEDKIGAQAKVNEAVLSKLKSLIDEGKGAAVLPALEKVGIAKDVARQFVDTVKSPAALGSIALANLDNGQINEVRSLVFFTGSDEGWLAIKPGAESSDVVLQSASADTAWKLLRAYLQRAFK